MGKKLHVGNLGYAVSDNDLVKMFETHGTVESAQIIQDRETGRSKGFGFVEMKTDQEAQAAIAALNGKDADGRALTVNEAKPRSEGGKGGAGGRGAHRPALRRLATPLRRLARRPGRLGARRGGDARRRPRVRRPPARALRRHRDARGGPQDRALVAPGP